MNLILWNKFQTSPRKLIYEMTCMHRDTIFKTLVVKCFKRELILTSSTNTLQGSLWRTNDKQLRSSKNSTKHYMRGGATKCIIWSKVLVLD